jgi:hypothetical protein
MLVIRRQQMLAFESTALQSFEDEMVAHSREFSPRLCEVLGDEQLRLAVRSAISRAMAYGLTNRGPIRLFIELMFLFGSGFDTDPQYPIFGRILGDEGDQMRRAEQMHEANLDYYDKVCGAGAKNVHNALQNIALFARTQVPFSYADFVLRMLDEMRRAFPQKVAYVGVEALTALIQTGRFEGRRYDFPPRGELLLVVLMFAFGHGCTGDPLYPWISQTLQDQRIVDASARAARLERKALTWLDHVNAANARKTST